MAKGRDLSAAFEAKVALEAIKGHKTINEIATESTETFWMKKCEVMGSDPSFTMSMIAERLRIL